MRVESLRAAFEIVFIPRNKFKKHDFNSGWNPTSIPPHEQKYGFTRKRTVRMFSLTVFLMMEKIL
ncbi:hypothetical protein BC351_37380 [Paenibacillus ferrarius]|uniref:Uncharacterized protein n=1 Tax=Paenibacillus ferrarius TaxID=1469647 RepID=A0A1V4HC56_9BACL|nr:hypothetical protein BC351_37380 [Paenibacillus ferrarius]